MNEQPPFGGTIGVAAGIAASTAAMFSWLIPDVATADPVFPLAGIASADPERIAGLLAVPVAGAISLLVILIPSTRRLAPWMVSVVALAGMWISLTMREPALPLSGTLAAGISTALCAAAVAVSILRPGARPAAHGIVVAAPLFLTAFTIAAIVSEEQSAAFTSPFREAVMLWAMTACVVYGISAWRRDRIRRRDR